MATPIAPRSAHLSLTSTVAIAGCQSFLHDSDQLLEFRVDPDIDLQSQIDTIRRTVRAVGTTRRLLQTKQHSLQQMFDEWSTIISKFSPKDAPALIEAEYDAFKTMLNQPNGLYNTIDQITIRFQQLEFLEEDLTAIINQLQLTPPNGYIPEQYRSKAIIEAALVGVGCTNLYLAENTQRSSSSLQSSTIFPTTDSEQTAQATNIAASIKLPKIELPRFSGQSLSSLTALTNPHPIEQATIIEATIARQTVSELSHRMEQVLPVPPFIDEPDILLGSDFISKINPRVIKHLPSGFALYESEFGPMTGGSGSVPHEYLRQNNTSSTTVIVGISQFSVPDLGRPNLVRIDLADQKRFKRKRYKRIQWTINKQFSIIWPSNS